MATPLADLLPALRLCIGDELISGTYNHTDPVLEANLRAIVQMGLGLPCVSVDPEDNTQLLHSSNAALNADEFGLIVLQTAIMMLGGQQELNYKTRALSVSAPSGAKRTVLFHLENKARELRENGTLCGSTGVSIFGIVSDISTWIREIPVAQPLQIDPLNQQEL